MSRRFADPSLLDPPAQRGHAGPRGWLHHRRNVTTAAAPNSSATSMRRLQQQPRTALHGHGTRAWHTADMEAQRTARREAQRRARAGHAEGLCMSARSSS